MVQNAKGLKTAAKTHVGMAIEVRLDVGCDIRHVYE